MCKDVYFYSGTQLWTHIDSDVTSNTLSFDFYTYQSNSQSRLSTPKVKFVIYTKNSQSIAATMTVAELYKYIYNVNNVIIKKINEHKTYILKDKKYTDGFLHKLYSNNIYTTIMYNVQLDAPCIRFMIGQKETSILDTDKVYIPLIEFISLFYTLQNTFNTFPTLSYNITYMDFMRKFNEDINDKLISIENKLSKINIRNDEKIETLNCNNILDDLKQITDKVEKVEESPVIEQDKEEVKNESEVHSDFDDFLKEKPIDTYKLDLPEDKKKLNDVDVEKIKDKTVKDVVYNDIFSNIVLKNDFKNLSMIITNSVNTVLPVDSFVNFVYSLTKIDLYKGFTDIDKYALNYIVHKNIKFHVNRYIDKKIDFPKKINPIIINDVEWNSYSTSQKSDKIEIMYFLILFYIYLSKVKNQLSEKTTSAKDNYEFLSFCLKTITSAFVFTYLIKVDKDILIGYINDLYIRLRNSGFFNNFEEDILKSQNIKIDVDCKYIKDNLSKIYDSVVNFKDKLTIECFFNKIMKLSYKDFKNIKIAYNSKIIEDICLIESHYLLNKMDKLFDKIKSTKDIPIEILNKYGLENKKFNNEILIKFIKTVDPNFKDIEQIRNINKNVHDILDNILIQNYPTLILRALYFWDVEKLPNNITYDMFSRLIYDSNLDNTSLLSMILDDNYKFDSDFYNSLSLNI